MNLVRIPLAPRGKNPLVFGWQNEPADSPVWESAARNVPDCNWGLRLDDLVVADCDSPEAVEFWERECPVATPVWSVGNPDRRSYWYRRPTNTLLRTCHLRPDLEIRTGAGAQQVTRPSLHPQGWTYTWIVDGETWLPLWAFPDELHELPEAPEEWILAQKPSVASWGDGEDGWDVIPEGGRNVALTAIGGLLRRHGAGKEAISTVLYLLNGTIVVPPLTKEELSKVSWSVSRYAPSGDVEVTWEEQEDDEVVSLEDEFRGYDGPRYIREGTPD